MIEMILVVALIALLAPCAAAEPRAVIYSSNEVPFNAVLGRSLAEAGYEVQRVAEENLSEAIATSPELLVLSPARRFPAASLGALTGYLERKGRLLAIGAPAFDELLVKQDEKWITVAEARVALSKLKPERLLFDFKPGDHEHWTRTTNHPETEERLSVFQGSMSSFVASVEGWNAYDSPVLEQPFDDGQTITVFEARGGANTRRLRVEWREKDTSRWIAHVPLSEGFRSYRLSPTDFHYWPDNSSSGRGGPGDSFDPASARQLSLGLADDEQKVGRGPHLWWIRSIGVSRDELKIVRGGPPAIECLSPPYKTYPMRDVARISARGDQAFVNKSFRMEIGAVGAMPVWRPRGAASGDGEGSDYRFIPLVDAFDAESNWRGSAAWAVACFKGARAVARWAGIALEPSLLETDAVEQVARLAIKLVSVLRAEALLCNAGDRQFRLAEDAAVGAAGSVWLEGDTAADVSVRAVFWHKGKEQELGRAEAGKAAGAAEWSLTPVQLHLEPGPAHLTTSLVADGKTVDEITQAFTIEPESMGLPKPGVQGPSITIDGRPTFLNGINYFPRYVLAHEDARYSLGWLEWWQYDPEMVERDLGILEAMHVNLVSVLYSKPSQGAQLADFLARCRHHSIFANVYIAGAHPLGFEPDLVRELLAAADLPRCPALLSYDLAWEPHLGKAEQRKQLDAQWHRWIAEQYGSAEAAVSDWGYAPESAGGTLFGPTDEQLLEDGSHRKMVTAYRRFADDIISRGYGRVARLVRSLDPVHLLGARTGYGGTGQQWPVTSMAYDVASGAAHLDFLSPEAYGVEGEASEFVAAGFTSEYCRLVSGGKPVFWAEYGKNIWPRSGDPKMLSDQRELYQKSYECLFWRSAAAGAAGWWFPGGYRVQEASDFGVVDQDGQLRPAGVAIHDWGHRLKEPPALAEPAGDLEIDRDLHVQGYAGVWASARQRYVEAALENRRLVPVTAGTGTTSANCPAVAVGGSAWNGSNPSKYLNAEISVVEVREEPGGQWQALSDGRLQIGESGTLELRALVTNSGEAKWLKGTGEAVSAGTVLLRLGGAFRADCRLPEDVAPLGQVYSLPVSLAARDSAGGRLQIRMACQERGEFGERVELDVAAP